MNELDNGRVPTAPGSHPSGHAASGVDGAPRFDPSRVAAGLSKPQRRALLRMNIREPHPSMPDYWAIEFYGGDLPASDVEDLIRMGLVTLPISTGGRGSPTYHGEIHPAGRAVLRALLRDSDRSARQGGETALAGSTEGESAGLEEASPKGASS